MQSHLSLVLLFAAPVALVTAQSCPPVHIFGARGTTIPQSNGYDLLLPLVNQLKSTYAGATSEAIVYPACGGQSSCGGVSYSDSAKQGAAAVATAVNNFHNNCPNTKLVLMGYSQVCGLLTITAFAFTNLCRVDKLLMTRYVEDLIPTRESPLRLFPFPQVHHKWSRQLFLWETLGLKLGLLMRLELARMEAYVYPRKLTFHTTC